MARQNRQTAQSHPPKKRCPEKYHTETQYYKGIPVTLIVYDEAHFAALRAKRFMLGTKGNQNVWIPNSYLDEAGRIRDGANLDWLFQRAYRENKFWYARIGINPNTWTPETPAPQSGRVLREAST